MSLLCVSRTGCKNLPSVSLQNASTLRANSSASWLHRQRTKSPRHKTNSTNASIMNTHSFVLFLASQTGGKIAPTQNELNEIQHHEHALHCAKPHKFCCFWLRRQKTDLTRNELNGFQHRQHVLLCAKPSTFLFWL